MYKNFEELMLKCESITGLQFEPNDVCVATFDIEKYGPEEISLFCDQIRKILYPIKVIAIPSGIKLEKVKIVNNLKEVEALL